MGNVIQEACESICEKAIHKIVYGKQLDLNEECEKSIQFEDRYGNININNSDIIL